LIGSIIERQYNIGQACLLVSWSDFIDWGERFIVKRRRVRVPALSRVVLRPLLLGMSSFHQFLKQSAAWRRSGGTGSSIQLRSRWGPTAAAAAAVVGTTTFMLAVSSSDVTNTDDAESSSTPAFLLQGLLLPRSSNNTTGTSYYQQWNQQNNFNNNKTLCEAAQAAPAPAVPQQQLDNYSVDTDPDAAAAAADKDNKDKQNQTQSTGPGVIPGPWSTTASPDLPGYQHTKAGMTGGGDERGLFHGLFPLRQLWKPSKPCEYTVL
jgi:hypothetical protein